MNLQEKKDLFAELEMGLPENFTQADALIKEIVEEDDHFFEDKNFWDYYKYPSLLPFIAHLAEDMLDKSLDDKQAVYGIGYMLFKFYLKMGNFERANHFLSKANTAFKYYDFAPEIITEVLYENDHVRFEYDLRLTKEICAYLVGDVHKTIEKNFSVMHPKPTIYLLYGKSPSPFDFGMNTVYLLIGQYQQNEFDREYINTSITHELTHIECYQHTKRDLKKGHYGNMKLFDEGLAIYNSYQMVGCREWKIKDDAFASSFYFKYRTMSLDDIMDHWNELLFGNRNFPQYELAHSFISFLSDKYNFLKVKAFFKSWLSDHHESEIFEFYQNYFTTPFVNDLDDWETKLLENFKIKNDQLLTITSIENGEEEIIIYYASPCALWPEKHIYVIDQENNWIFLTTDNPKRFQKEGRFALPARAKGKDLTLYVGCEGKNQMIVVSC